MQRESEEVSNPSSLKTTRRDLIAGALSAGAAAAVGGLGAADARAASEPGSAAAAAAKPFRVAHLTDMHVQPQRAAGEGYAAALRSLEKLDPVPDLILTGGDHVMDTLETELPRTKLQWDLYDKVLAENTKIPAHPVIGNHDVWAWGVPGQVPPNTPGWGKAMAVERLKIPGRFYSFDAGGWHFICLDNIAPRGTGYFAALDDEQTEWLKGDLAANAKTPTCVASHIPLLAACVFFNGGKGRMVENHYHVPDALMHREVKPVLDLFKGNNVKLAVSGHLHLVDRVDYLGTTFLCNGAVSGAWWKGPHQEFAEGYGVIDLWPDGRFEHQYVTYGWEAKRES